MSSRLNHTGGYSPAYALEIIAIMADGYSATAAAGKMGVHREKLNQWAKQHPEFADALKRGETVRIFKLETDLLRARNSMIVRARMFMLKHAAPMEYGKKSTEPPPIEDPFAEAFRHLSGNVPAGNS